MKDKLVSIRFTETERKMLTELTTEYGITKTKTYCLSLGLQLYFDNYANCKVKKTGKKVWKE